MFEDNFGVFDVDSIPFKERTSIENVGLVTSYSNKGTVDKKQVDYYEIVFSRSKTYSFLVYHSLVKESLMAYFDHLSCVLNNLSNSISLSKGTAFDQLKSIMACLKTNPLWTSTHVASQVGFEIHFKESSEIATREINIQVEPDKATPLHLAIFNNLYPIVKAILELNPNLNLVDAKEYSVLHSAVLSIFEIFALILAQPQMFERIPWKNNLGCTALHLACFAKKYNIVFEFLKFGLTVRMLTIPPPKKRGKNRAVSEIGMTQSKKPSIYDRIVIFTEQDFYDIDCQDIEYAGSPLHWCLHKRLIEKLIAYNFKLNIKNMIGDSPLHVMAKRKRLKCVISLLCSGADVNSRNKFGNTPLHHAVKIDDIVLVQTFIAFDAEINVVNKVNETPRHIASKESTFSKIILYTLSSVGATRCPPEMKNCHSGCIHDGDFEGKNPAYKHCPENNQSIFNVFKNFFLFEQEMSREDISDEEKKNGINMLALDGGGIKGLITLQILGEFQKYLDRPIVDYFDWIAGTSTGSFIATFLTMRKTIDQIRNIYFQMKDKIFVGERPYEAEILEKYMQEILGPNLKMGDLKTKYNKHVMIPATLFDRNPMKLHLFRSYESHHEILNMPENDPGFPSYPSREQYVWKACRASGSAPTYFKAFGPFIDGGMMANNPTLDALTEFEFYNTALTLVGRSEECRKLRFVLSLGCGKQQPEKFNTVEVSAFSVNLMELNTQIRYLLQMGSLLLNEVTSTEHHVVNRSIAFCSASGIIIFRISPYFNKLFELDETLDFKIVNLLWETKKFLYSKRVEIQRIAEYLKKFTYFPKKNEKDIMTEQLKKCPDDELESDYSTTTELDQIRREFRKTDEESKLPPKAPSNEEDVPIPSEKEKDEKDKEKGKDSSSKKYKPPAPSKK